MTDSSETWDVAALRTTFFSTGPSFLDTQECASWWKSFAGEEPAEEFRKPREGIYDARGPFLEHLLQLQVQALRIDWNFIPHHPQGQMADPLAPIGPLARVDQFIEQVATWIPSNSAPVGRLAYGAVLQRSAPDRIAGYKALASYLPSVKIDVEGSSDFHYQINRPRQSTVLRGLLINRLSKWAVALSRPISFVFGMNSPIVTAASAGSQYAIRLELDVNSSPDNTSPIPNEDLVRLLRELAGLGQEIASRGDVP